MKMIFSLRGAALRLLLLLVSGSAWAQSTPTGTVVPHPVPWEFASDRYSVTVNGHPVTVMLAAMNLHVASFDFTGRVEVQVTINKDDYNRVDGRPLPAPDAFWQGAAVVRPLSRSITPTTDGRTVRFSIASPGQFSIERPGTHGFEDEVLFLFANPPEQKVPSATDPDVIWLGPGTHQRTVDLASGQTLYLAPGAVLFGGINVWDAENVRISGRGSVVYYGPQSMNVDSGWMHRKNWHPLTAHAVKGLTVEGVTFVGRSRVWTIQLWQTFDSLFDNIKVVTSFPANLNGDGIDWYGGGRAIVRNSFFRVADDCFAVHTADSSVALRVDRGGGGHLPGAPAKETPRTTGEVSDIVIERCVFWPTLANIFRAGWNNQALTTRNITLRDCDVIHLAKHEWLGSNDALFTTVIPSGEGESRHRDYLFEDIRCEEATALLSVNWPQARLENFVFRNIQLNGGAGKSLFRASGDGLVFDRVQVNDRPVANPTDVNLTFDGEVKRVRFSPAAAESREIRPTR